MRKYDMRICNCGRIHAIPTKKIDKALENKKDLLFICGNCGRARLIGADDYMYTVDFTDNEVAEIDSNNFVSTETHKGIDSIFYSKGTKVPMKTGYRANFYCDDKFYDNDFSDIERFPMYDKKRETVDMKRFINENSEEFLDELSNYLIPGLDWTGTKYKKF